MGAFSGGSMSRRDEREQAFALLFERQLNREPVEDLIENAGLARDFEITEFTEALAFGVEEHEEEINALISDNLRGWSFQRLSKTTVALLQLSVYEILYREEIPEKVSVNESVELAKLYGGEDDPSYINGVLGGIVKGLGRDV